MTDSNHPITPPPELVKQWLGTYFGATVTGEVSDVELALVHQAARWGADQELEACCAHMNDWGNIHHSCGLDLSNFLRTARRPKQPSLKEQALAALNEIEDKMLGPTIQEQLIRQALESLPD